MQKYLRFAAISIVLLFVGSLMVGFVSNFDAPKSEILSDEPVIQNPSQRVVQGTLSSANISLRTTVGTVPSLVEDRTRTTPSSKIILMTMSTLPTCLHPTVILIPHVQETLHHTTGFGPEVERLMHTLVIEPTRIKAVQTVPVQPMTAFSKAVAECTAPLMITV